MKNLIKILLTILGVIIGASLFAQDFSQDCKNEMKAFTFLTGKWEGQGWVITPAGTKESSMVTEEISFDLDETIIKLRGVGMAEKGGEMLRVHDALGVLYYDPFQKSYKMNSWISRGLNTQASVALLENGKMNWQFSAGPNRMIRYTIEVIDDQWHEIGEVSLNEGATWIQFFQMDLAKKDAATDQ